MAQTRLLEPKFEIFWKGIKSELEKILQADIPVDPLLFILEISPEHMYTKDYKYMLHIQYIVDECEKNHYDQLGEVQPSYNSSTQ